MRFMIGLPLQPDKRFIETALRNTEKIQELYFAWPGIASGRGNGAAQETEEMLEEYLLPTLECFHDKGIALNLLLNGNCYGKNSQSRAFFQNIGDVADFLSENFALASVTTTSPLIAKFLKQNFPALECRASVNMEIGTVEGMEYLSSLFDGFYLKRELNRSFSEIGKMKSWCRNSGKKLYALANSGCLNFCSAHNFHDNLVAHEHEISAMDNAYEFRSVCGEYLKTPEGKSRLLQRSNFIRPEDMHLYGGIFDGVKLATRSNPNPSAVLQSYFRERHSGNLLNLLEPDHSQHFYPEIIENSLIPPEWAENVLHCNKNCAECRRCTVALEKSIVNLSDDSKSSKK